MNKKYWILAIGGVILIIIFPPFINSLMTFGNAETSNDWIGFFGSYIGALVGAAVAVIVSRIQAKGTSEDLSRQIEEQNRQVRERIDNEIRTLKLANRVFIDYTMNRKPLLLSDKQEDTNKILLPREAELYIKHNDNEFLETKTADFLILEFNGAAECVLDLKIKLTLTGGYYGEEDEVNYMYLAGWRKGHGVYIPFAILEPDSDVTVVKLDIEYTTLQQETLRFVSDMRTRKETYYLIEECTETLIFERELYSEQYINPGNKWSIN